MPSQNYDFMVEGILDKDTSGYAPSSYYDMLVNALVSGGVDKGEAKRYASEENDERLRHELGYSRKKGKGEKLPEGHYSLAEYPMLHHEIFLGKGGNVLPGALMPGLFSGIVPGSIEDQQIQNKRKKWAEIQQGMLKPGGFWSR